jgi:large subunit ribosomal protein L35
MPISPFVPTANGGSLKNQQYWCHFGAIYGAKMARTVNAPAVTRLQAAAASAITPPFADRLIKGCRGGDTRSIPSTRSRHFVLRAHPGHAGSCPQRADEESKMPKLKTKSGAKKRFKITASGKVKYQQSGKRHGMIKRTTKQIREHRGTNVLFKTDGDNIKKYFLPNG